MKNFHTTSTHPVRALKFIGLALLFLLATGTLKGRAQTSNVLFSRPVPDLFPGTPFLCCIIGDFEEPSPVHNWKVRLRSSSTEKETVVLNVAATTVNPAETGGIRATITDENGLNVFLVPFLPVPEADNIASLGLSLWPGNVYDLTIERIAPETGPVAHHYKLGSPDKRLELGWEDPLRFLEPPLQAWVVHADQGENVVIEFPKDMLPPADPTKQITARLEQRVDSN